MPQKPINSRLLSLSLTRVSVLSTVLILTLSGCNAPSFGTKLTAGQITEIGAEAAVQIDSQYQPPAADAPGVAVFKEAADRITHIAKRMPPGAVLRFAAIETDEEIAMSLPDGHIYISSGLLAKIADKPDEIGCVLADQAGHVALSHDTENLAEALGESTIEDMLSQGKYQDIVDTQLELMRLSYTKDQEGQADKYAVRIAGASGYDASALSRFLIFEASEPRTESSVLWSDSHPVSKGRINGAVAAAKTIRH